MQHAKTIFVTGATGNQGGAVVRSLLNNGFKVKALTRNADSPEAQIIKNLNAEIVQGNLNNPSTYRKHLEEIDGIFCVLTFQNGIREEISQGKELANLAKSYNVSHFLYSSVIGADLHTGIPHWESKLMIENHIKQQNLPYTIIRPAALFENFLIPAVKKRILKGTLPSPLTKEVIQLFISSSDIGNISSLIFLNPDQNLRKTILLATEGIDQENVARIFSNALGREIKYQKMPMVLTRLFMGKNLYTMFKWYNENYACLIKNQTIFLKDFPNMLNLSEWIKQNFKIAG
ncbi:MAG TPA: NmrA/HSCARG family protein [Chitinophagaceae bacterium]|jgi:uncharacterized protein YbjT (DUF2867 family)|nr:NmrA/HSCARG family protein [Chitinophagaceae bacterium]